MERWRLGVWTRTRYGVVAATCSNRPECGRVLSPPASRRDRTRGGLSAFGASQHPLRTPRSTLLQHAIVLWSSYPHSRTGPPLNAHTMRPMRSPLALAALSAAFPMSTSPAQVPVLSPKPKIVMERRGSLPLVDGFAVTTEANELREHARVLSSELEALLGFPASTGDAGSLVKLELIDATEAEPDAAGLEGEGYVLVVDEHEATVRALNGVGIAWGTATLLQLLQSDGDLAGAIPCVEIRDEPAAPFRAVLVDVARQPHTIDTLRGVVELARLHKVRFIQLHLTDDQLFAFPFAPVTDALEGNSCFTRDELEGLVAFAAARGVTIIPEVDLPGHSSRLVQSGYLEGAEDDRDVADPKYEEALERLFDEVMDVFANSPYFHIGGDESGAGDALVPFLERVNEHVRSRGKCLIVWEGFHGAPTDALPAEGPDRVLVMAWESSYNAPWDLLANGYEIVNASWRPVYVVGGGSLIHPGSSAGRKWSPEEIAYWHKDRFMHWEPGRAVFEDRGPDDRDRTDHTWDVPKDEWRARVLGGQMCVWEQRDGSVLGDLRERLPVLAARLWSGDVEKPAAVVDRVRAVDSRVYGLVQPVAVSFDSNASGPMNLVAHHLGGESSKATFAIRTRQNGELRWSIKAMGGDWNWIDFPDPGAPSTVLDERAVAITGSASIRAALFAPDGTQIGSETWARCIDWPNRVHVTEFELPRRRSGAPERVDFSGLGVSTRTGSHLMPMLRGPLDHTAARGQRNDATLVAPGSGEYVIGIKTQSGWASLSLDLDGDEEFSPDEMLVAATPNSEELIARTVTLEEGRRYALRVDHETALPRPVLIVTLDEPGNERPTEITRHLAPIGR